MTNICCLTVPEARAQNPGLSQVVPSGGSTGGCSRPLSQLQVLASGLACLGSWGHHSSLCCLLMRPSPRSHPRTQSLGWGPTLILPDLLSILSLLAPSKTIFPYLVRCELLAGYGVLAGRRSGQPRMPPPLRFLTSHTSLLLGPQIHWASFWDFSLGFCPCFPSIQNIGSQTWLPVGITRGVLQRQDEARVPPQRRRVCQSGVGSVHGHISEVAW